MGQKNTTTSASEKAPGLQSEGSKKNTNVFNFIARCNILAGAHPWVFVLAVIAVLEAGLKVLEALQ